MFHNYLITNNQSLTFFSIILCDIDYSCYHYVIDFSNYKNYNNKHSFINFYMFYNLFFIFLSFFLVFLYISNTYINMKNNFFKLIQYSPNEYDFISYIYKGVELYDDLSNNFISDDFYNTLTNKYVIELTPKGYVIMNYNYSNNSFYYYTNNHSIMSYENLETVSRLYTIYYNTKYIHKDNTNDLDYNNIPSLDKIVSHNNNFNTNNNSNDNDNDNDNQIIDNKNNKVSVFYSRKNKSTNNININKNTDNYIDNNNDNSNIYKYIGTIYDFLNTINTNNKDLLYSGYYNSIQNSIVDFKMSYDYDDLNNYDTSFSFVKLNNNNSNNNFISCKVLDKKIIIDDIDISNISLPDFILDTVYSNNINNSLDNHIIDFDISINLYTNDTNLEYKYINNSLNYNTLFFTVNNNSQNTNGGYLNFSWSDFKKKNVETIVDDYKKTL